MNGLLDMFSREAGQRRRAWLDEKTTGLLDAAQYYAGPGVPVHQLAELAGMLNPVNDLYHMQGATRRAMEAEPGERFPHIMDAATNAATFLAPVAGGAIANRMYSNAGGLLVDDGARAANAMAETFTSTSQAGKRAARDFAADESAALRITQRGDYTGSHKAPSLERGATLEAPIDIFGDDIYSPRAMQYFGTGDRVADGESLRVIQRARNNPNADVTVYRAVPRDAPDDINAGDWVTTSRRYAEGHGQGPLRGDYKIVEERVRAGELATDGNSLHEWGWWPDSKRAADETPAQEVARMLREGRSAEVTDDMMARVDPQEMRRLYESGATGMDMPLDEASRMARARDMGFDTSRTLYHGTPDQRQLQRTGFDALPQGQKLRGIGEWVDAPRPAFTSNQRSVARTYADPNRAWDYQGAEPGVLDLYRRTGNDAVIDAQGARFRGLHGGDVSDATGVDLNMYRGQVQDGEISTDGLSMILNDQGFTGARIRNVVDDYMGYGKPSEVQMTMNPNDLRLKSARFDPRLSHLANLSASAGGLGVLVDQLGIEGAAAMLGMSASEVEAALQPQQPQGLLSQ